MEEPHWECGDGEDREKEGEMGGVLAPDLCLRWRMCPSPARFSG